MLYDFGLNVGDTFCFDYLGIGCFQVAYFDSIWVNGQYRRIFHFNDYWNISWIEGVGNSIGWFELQVFGTGNRDLLCFKQNNDTLINAYGYCSCSPATTINEISNQTKNITIYPNPFSSSATVKISDDEQKINNYELIVYDVFGKVILKSVIINQQTEINRGNLPGGVYFYEITNQQKPVVSLPNHHPVRGKLIIQ
ncbi:MAG: T9SS type A sorting domain-containing protein [Bacteroidetes bacterium]|nr:T9SS type A sorting domain-containing protein [Bacteroidota bacterium]